MELNGVNSKNLLLLVDLKGTNDAACLATDILMYPFVR